MSRVMPKWRNGRRDGLKNRWGQLHVGSTPTFGTNPYTIVGAWLSLVERSVRDAEVGGSNPLAPTTEQRGSNDILVVAPLLYIFDGCLPTLMPLVTLGRTPVHILGQRRSV